VVSAGGSREEDTKTGVALGKSKVMGTSKNCASSRVHCLVAVKLVWFDGISKYTRPLYVRSINRVSGLCVGS
jgi:hypothetical protein